MVEVNKQLQKCCKKNVTGSWPIYIAHIMQKMANASEILHLG